MNQQELRDYLTNFLLPSFGRQPEQQSGIGSRRTRSTDLLRQSLRLGMARNSLSQIIPSVPTEGGGGATGGGSAGGTTPPPSPSTPTGGGGGIGASDPNQYVGGGFSLQDYYNSLPTYNFLHNSKR